MIKLCPCLSYFRGSFGHFESLAFFRKWGDKPYTTAVKHNILVNKVTIFKKSPVILTKKMRTNLTVDNYRRFFLTKNFFTVEKLWLFGLFSGDKGDNIDM